MKITIATDEGMIFHTTLDSLCAEDGGAVAEHPEIETALRNGEPYVIDGGAGPTFVITKAEGRDE